MASPSKENLMKVVGNNSIFVAPIAYGFKSKICKGRRNDSSIVEYAVKCITNVEAKKMEFLINKEVKYAPQYIATNVLIKFQLIQQTSNNVYLFYSYYESKSLDILFSLKNLTNDRKIIIAQNLAKAIYSLHQAKLMHRNLYPAHVLVSSTNSIILCGVKSIYDFKQEYPSEGAGTDPYKAPEIDSSVLCGGTYDEKVDVFSFGVILHQLFTDKPYLLNMHPSEIEKNSLIPPKIKELIIKCVKVEPGERIPSSQIISPDFYKIGAESVSLAIPDRTTLDPYLKKTKILLGEGAFGKVYEIVNQETNTKCAIKMIKLEKLKGSIKAKELIYGEINLLYSLRDLNFVIYLYEAFHYKSKLCMALELCNGGNLDNEVSNLFKRSKFLTVDDIKLIGWNIAEGLNILHERNIVHRDLKPENILLIKDDKGAIIEAKICDLGLGKQLKEDYPEFNTVCGTDPYYAPELRLKKAGRPIHLTNKIDVFSFGLILYFMIYGQDASKRQKNKYNFCQGIVDIQILERIPQELFDLIKLCLDPDPEKRIPFQKIILSPFFVKTSLSKLPSSYSFILKKAPYDSKTSIAVIDKSKKFWIKVYKESAYEGKDLKKYIGREIDFLFKSKAIPHITHLEAFGTYEKTVAQVFSYCNGGSLINQYVMRSNLKNNNELPIFSTDEIKCVARCLIQFIDKMHGLNYLHRSINLKHILTVLDPTNKIIEAKVCGFRSAKSENSDVNMTMTVEDFLFVDPLSFSEGYYEESDLWSIGLVIYFMAFKETIANDIEKLKNIRKEPEKLIFPKNVDENIAKFIHFCIRKKEPDPKSNILLAEKLIKENIKL